MAKQRRRFSKEFKQEAVQMVRGGRPIHQPSREGFRHSDECVRWMVPRARTGWDEGVLGTRVSTG